MIVDATLQTLIRELGSDLGVGDLILDGDGACALRIDGKLRIDFQYRPDREHLILYADLGEAPDEPDLYAELLRGNLFWQNTFGATLSLSNDMPPHIVIAQSLEWRSQRLSTLKTVLERFVSTAEDWKEIVRAPTEAGSTSADSMSPGDGNMTVFRL